MSPSETLVRKTSLGSIYRSVAAAENIFRVEAGLRGEFEFFSYTTSPLCASIKIIDGFAKMGDKSISLNTAGIVEGERTACAGATEITNSAVMPADNFRTKFFFNKLVPQSRN